MSGRCLKLAAALPALALCACSLAPPYVQPVLPVPSSWPIGDAYLTQSEASLPVVSYKDIFRDPRLQSLIEQALANNRDVRQALANVEAARAQVTVVRANQFPDVTVDGSAGRTVLSKGANGSDFTLEGGVSSFELDLFGRLRNATVAQRDTALGTEAAARTVRLTLVADLATAWATYASDKDLLSIARETVASAQSSLTLQQARLRGGVAPRTDVRSAEQVLETARGDVAARTAAMAKDIDQMRLLVGAEFDRALLPDGIDAVNQGLGTIPAGTTTQVLLRRPDVVEAEYTLRADDADIGVARAELFPTISLSALVGLASGGLSSLFSGSALSGTGSVAGSWSIFNAGGKRAAVTAAKANRDAVLAAYEKAIQTAFQETADALADQGTLGERLRAARAYTAAAVDSAQLTQASYREGISSAIDNLEAQRSAYAARQSEIAVRLTVATNRITLYQVLGGDQSTALAQR